MIRDIANATKENSLNEIINECIVKDKIISAYNQFIERIKAYMSSYAVEENAQIFVWFTKYLNAVCANATIHFPKPQSEALKCSHDLVDKGIILPIFNEMKNKKLSEILDNISKDKCESLHMGLQNLVESLRKCSDQSELNAFSNLLEKTPKISCLQKVNKIVGNGM